MLKLFFLFLFTASLNAQVVRAALDVGSGALKLVVAEINEEKECIEQIYYSEEFPIGLKKDMQLSGLPYFSEAIQIQTQSTLKQLQAKVAIYNPTAWSGIATMACRQSHNAPELFNKIKSDLNIPISIISQQEEGRIGFGTAVAVSKLKQNDIVAFDSGGASFQISTLLDNDLKVIKGDIGYVPAESLLLNDIRHLPYHNNSPNPVYIEEIWQLVDLLKKRLPHISTDFCHKIRDPSTKVVGIGGETSLFYTAYLALKKNRLHKDELLDAIKVYAGMTDEQLQIFKVAHEAVIDLTLLYAIMDGLNIDQIDYYPSNGSCEGLLIDKNYW